MSQQLSGRTAIVSGAANGIGLAVARRFLDAGANVMLTDIDEDKLEAETKALEAPESAQFFPGDLRKKLTIANLISATVDAFDNIDILVNASRQVLQSDPLDAKTDAFDALMEQNVEVTLRLSQAVSKRMIKHGDPEAKEVGAIVNLSSLAAGRALPQLLGYSVSCAAVDQLTRSLAVALSSHKIRVNAISIGSVMSASLHDKLRETPEMREELIRITPLGRIGEAEEAAEAALFLASPAASFITGQILGVDGGRTLIDPMLRTAH